MDGRSSSTYSSDEDQHGDEDMHEAVITANDRSTLVAKGRPHPEHVGRILESLYKSGITGWGAKHSSNLDQAVRSTGLNLSQVKVIG